MRTLGKVLWRLSVSYGTACVLLVFLFLLTLFGTLEQVDDGLYAVQKKYFESWFLFHDLGPISIPLPGGVLCMGLLSWNLIAGGLVRIRKARATVGVIIGHVGILLMFAAGLVKLTASNDGYLRLYEGEESDEYVSYFLWEVVVFDADKSGSAEFVVSDEQLRRAADGAITVSHPYVPFDLELRHFLEHSRPTREESPLPLAGGLRLLELEKEQEAEANYAGVYAFVPNNSGGTETAILWGGRGRPWVVEFDGRRWAVHLRHRPYRMPFSIHLDEFTKLDHPGTNIASEYSSDVTQKTGSEERAVLIRMNEPLRDQGLVLFQSSWGPSNAGPRDRLFSVFSVVQNPSDHWPLYSCIIIGVGLLIAFSQKLIKYVRAQNLQRAEGFKEFKE